MKGFVNQCATAKNKGTADRGASCRCDLSLADALPGLAAAEHAAEGATLDAQRVRAAHRDGRVVVAAGVRIMNAANPLGFGRLHVDQDALVAFHRIAAQILAALLDAHIAL